MTELDKQQQVRRLVLLGGVAVVIFALDQVTKVWAVDSLKDQEDISFLGGIVRLLYAENTGAWGSLGQNWPEPLKLVIMTLLPLAVLGWIAVRLIRDHDLPKLEAVAYALIISGGIGNIVDRIRLGYVVDFMWMGVGPLTTNIFNIADVAIVTAMALLIIEAYLAHVEKKKSEKVAAAAPPSETPDEA